MRPDVSVSVDSASDLRAKIEESFKRPKNKDGKKRNWIF
jgi:hypothetical protein